mmetsp:Transcript_18932/g.21730  ORF Transcript_18932/g.21730 Transcript_18932/m.21730 type:complete len:99 (-) Transcript_18932:675-971(-)
MDMFANSAFVMSSIPQTKEAEARWNTITQNPDATKYLNKSRMTCLHFDGVAGDDDVAVVVAVDDVVDDNNDGGMSLLLNTLYDDSDVIHIVNTNADIM